MTDARIPERYLMDRRIVRLTDAQRSSYFMAVLWSVSNRTDGQFDRADLPLIPTFSLAAVDALVDSGLWAVTDRGWVDVEFLHVQTSKHDLEVLDNARRADREKKRRQRSAKREAPSYSPAFPGTVPGTFPGDDTGEERTGKARTGKDYEHYPDMAVNSATGEVDQWHTVAIPDPDGTDCVCSTHQTSWPCVHDTPDCEWSYPV